MTDEVGIAPEDDNKDARERKAITMYKKKRVYHIGNLFLSRIIDASPNGANPHYP
ncbi:MAG: hypothetical protein KAW88_08730 [Candidatus Cloacimonetes bacterium]|nr:hypothetical protein [Candidatus Cloacimonadota bacterium]